MVRNILDKLTSEIQVMEANPHLYTRAAVEAKRLEFAQLVESLMND
jgi:hypothetical protein